MLISRITSLSFFLTFSALTLSGQPSTSSSTVVPDFENHLIPNVLFEGEAVTYMSLQDRMAHHKVPGVSIAFFENGEISWTRCYGYQDDSLKTPVTPTTRFQAASISKPVAAMAALTLVEAGRLALDEDINRYLKSWKVPDSKFTEKEKVTLRRLVTHSAGMTVHGFPGYAAGEPVPTTRQVITGEEPTNTDAIRPDTFPGALWRYSGGGYTVMQLTVEDITGQPFPEFMQQAVLAEAGMEHSTYQQPLPASYYQNAASAYRGDGRLVEGNWHTYPEMAAAGLWTTPSDLARWAIELQNAAAGKSERVLSQAMAKKVLTKHLGDWGLGPALHGEGDSLSFGHGGANEGFRCQLFAFAKEGGQGVAIMTNSDNGSALTSEILRGLSDLYGWNRYEPAVKKVVQLNTAMLDSYTGKFVAPEGFTLDISRQEGQLFVKQLWNGAEYPILAESETAFFAPGDLLDFVFEPAAKDGKSHTVRVMNGNYTLKRQE